MNVKKVLGPPRQGRHFSESSSRGANLAIVVGRLVSLDIVIQAAGFAAGILVVRNLSIIQYGQYAIFTGFIFAVSALAETGLSALVMALAAKVEHDRRQLGRVFRSALHVKLVSGLFLIPTGGVFLYFLLIANKMTAVDSFVTCLIFGVTVLAMFASANHETALRFAQKSHLMQINQIGATILRLIAIVGVSLVLNDEHRLLAVVFITCAGYWLQALLMQRATRALFGSKARTDRRTIRELRRGSRSLAPMTVAIIGREQAFIVIVSLFGSSAVIAQVTALSRFSIVFGFISSIVVNVVAPKLSRLSAGDAERTYRRTIGAYLVVVGSLAGAMAFASTPIVWLLGKNYNGLELEFVIIVCGSAIMSLTQASSYLGQVRAWTGGSWTLLLGSVGWLIAGALFCNLHDPLAGAIFFGSQFMPAVISEIVRYLRRGRITRPRLP